MKILLAGASGTIGRAVAETLVADGHHVLCPLRPGAETAPGAVALETDPTDRHALAQALGNRGVDALVSCLASRTGVPADAWAVEHRAQNAILAAAAEAGARRIILLSAICVQKPRLAFQHAKRAFERDLMASGLDWTIVRPTAFFKSLSGQVARVTAGRPFLVFGDGDLTSCKPISDRDLARFLADSLDRAEDVGRILPIGGPGPAITPRAQAEYLFARLGQKPRIKRVPPGLLRLIGGGLGLAGRAVPSLAAKAELARIGHYYATESMLVWDPDRACYDAAATPETGSDTLWDHYDALLDGRCEVGLGAHAVF